MFYVMSAGIIIFNQSILVISISSVLTAFLAPHQSHSATEPLKADEEE